MAAQLPMFERKLSDEELPKHVDWRGTGADGRVKDQATCGEAVCVLIHCHSHVVTGIVSS
jgi:hypothetical protein